MRASSLRCLPLLIAAGALPLAAQTTGNVQGRVVDPKGAPVAGARVSLSGANLQGVRVVNTDADGSFRLSLLPPGPCVLTVTKEGFNAQKSQVQVALDRTASVELKLAAIAQAVVEVVDQATAVDVKATTLGANFTNESFEKLPVSRDFANIALLSPGVTKDDAGFKVYGASGAENNYVVDGINATGVEFGTQGKRVPMEFIQEFQVKTGGYEAEYGKALGGIINVITKSGGNEFSGDAFAYSEGVLFKSGNRHVDDLNLKEKPLLLEDKTLEVGFDLGGYLVKDKVWFFVAYDRRRNNQVNQIRVPGPNQGDEAPTDSTRDLFAGKVTWQMAEGHTLIASFLGDPEKITGAVKTPQGSTATWDGEHKVGGTDLSLRYETTGANWFGHLQVSRHNETNSTLPGAAGASLIQQIDNASGAASGGFGRFDDKEFTRDMIQGAFAYILGGHELKAGFEFQNDKADIRRGFTGGQQVTLLDQNGGTPIYSHYWWTTPDAMLGPPYDSGAAFNAPSITFTSKPKHESKAYFLQDKWTISPKWTVNAGVRLDLTDIVDPNGVTVASFKNQWAPRLGVIWDFKGKGTDKVYASASRYYEQIPLDLVIRSFSMERNPTTFNYSATGFAPDAGAEVAYTAILQAADPTASPVESNIYGYSEPVDPDIKGSYSDEFILGAETTLANRYVVGAKFIRRYLGRAIEDALDPTSPNGDYFIMNPGQSHPLGVTYPDATRDYRGVEITAQRKFADHYTWQASYLWSKLDGNYEGAFQGIGGADGTGQLDPNINAAYDLPEFITNSWGRLSGDRKHQFKANGYYEWDFGLSLGASFQYMSGTPISRLGYHTGYGRYELFLLPRGTEGETPSTTQLDLNLAYTLKVATRHQVRFNLDVTNALNTQTATVIDQRYNRQEGGPQVAGYKQPFAFQAPRSIRIGVRYSF
ncbi:MAG TPA: TonB-dependent receptor [Holophagaceae bacterium]|nr:TonB-dependent receptor [Holophagaceae bacterium]